MFVSISFLIIFLNIIGVNMISLNRKIYFRFNPELKETYSLKYKVKDITKIRGLSTQPYILIENQKIAIPKNKMIVDIVAGSPFNEIDRPPSTTFLDNNLNFLHPTVPAISLLSQSFYVKINESLYYVANNQSIIRASNSPQYLATDSSQVLEPVVRTALRSMDKQSEGVSPNSIHSTLVKNVLDCSLSFKLQKIRYKELLKVVDERIKHFQKQIQTINQKVHQKAVKRTTLFSSFMLAQYGLVHWLIYYHLSWDIMEPITVLLGNLDLLLGYYFFVFKGREYSLEEIQQNIHEKGHFKYLKKHGFNLQKYEELIELKEVLQMRIDVFSKSPFALMSRFEGRIRLLDTR